MEISVKGKILKGVGGLYSVIVLSEGEYSGDVVRCRARGVFRHTGLTPLPGDFVMLSYDNSRERDEDGKFVIDEIVDRRNSLIRPPLANLDYLFVTMAAAAPAPILPTVDKLISIAEHNKIEPVIVITKRELNEERADELLNIYRASGFTCFALSAVENVAIEPIDNFIKQSLPHKTAAFAGASGIGKSTLLNRLFPELELTTSEISRKIERGRHTTREVNLFPLSSTPDCGYIADTPGFSMLDFKRFDFFEKEDLVDTMREFAPYIGECRYTKCSHTKEEGCAIIRAVRNGDIPKSRHESYVELYDILKTRKKWD
ncbi:MAG: ribosome small subunit-dependent GTPase A [Clostridia bacterium]|nr:ribosome small subunit-dependent GTPase A [Clostridia bacterium]